MRIPALDAIRAAGIALVIGLVHSQRYIETAVGSSLYVLQGWSTIGPALALGPVTCVAGYAARISFSRLEAAGLTGPPAARAFLVRRLVRLYPLYLIFFLLFVAIYYSDMSVHWLVLQVLGVGVLVNKVVQPELLTLYYVQLLLLFYAVFALAMMLRRVALRVSAIVMGWVALVVVGYFVGDMHLPVYYPCFWFGALAPLQSVVSPRRVQFLLGATFLIAACSLVAFVKPPDRYVVLLVAVIGLAAFVAALPAAHWLSRGRGGSVLAQISYASFGAYLIHRPLDELLRFTIGPDTIWSALLVFVGMTTILSFLAGFVIQTLYDRAINEVWHSRTGSHG